MEEDRADPRTLDSSHMAAQEMSPSDEALARRAGEEREAFMALYQRYIAGIYSYVVWKLGSTYAEDVTSDIFMCALEGIHRFRPAGSFRAWLFGIARHRVNRYYRYLKKRGRARPLQDVEEQRTPGNEGDPEHTVMEMERAARLRTLVANLPEPHREVIELRYWAGLPIREVASLVGKSEGAVRVLIHRTLKILRDQWEG